MVFKTDEDEYTNSNLTIVFELINEDEYTNNDFNVVVPVDFKSNKDLEHEKRVNQILGK